MFCEIRRSACLPKNARQHLFDASDELIKTKKAALREQSGPGIQLLRPAQERLVLM